MACNCNTYDQIATGGLSAGGQATLSVNQITGGISCGGSAHVAIAGDVWDGLKGVWPLDEWYWGVEDEVDDLTRNELHGTSGYNGWWSPWLDYGVFCLYSQAFWADSFIRLPADGIDGPFAYSFWCKVDDSFNSKSLVTRGDSRIWYSIARHIMFEAGGAMVNTDILLQDRWYHVACEYDGESITIYLNGDEQSTLETTEAVSMPTSETYVGSTETMTGMPMANMQEVRLYPEAKGSHYYLTEYRNFCDPGFIDEGEEQSPVYS